MKHLTFILLIAIALFSCKKQDELVANETAIDLGESEVFIGKIGVTLTAKVNQELKTWGDYQVVDERMRPYYKITKNEALQNAEELAFVILDASDTITFKKLDRPDIKIRFNVLYNHALRLQDMNMIPSITDSEVKMEVQQLLEAYSALNDKINVVYKIDQFKGQYERSSQDSVLFFDEGEIDYEINTTNEKSNAGGSKSAIEEGGFIKQSKSKSQREFQGKREVN